MDRGWFSRNWRPLLIVAVGLAIAIVFVKLLGECPNLATALVAFGTLVLAVVTAFSIDASDRRERNRIAEDNRVRQEEREHDFRRRSIDGIIDWALKLTDPRFKIPDVVTAKKYWTTMTELEQLATRNIWIDNVAGVFGNDFLSTACKTTQNLDNYVSTLHKWFSKEVKLGKVSEAHRALENSLEELLEFAFVIKASERL
jgi:hypothetical protein